MVLDLLAAVSLAQAFFAYGAPIPLSFRRVRLRRPPLRVLHDRSKRTLTQFRARRHAQHRRLEEAHISFFFFFFFLALPLPSRKCRPM